MRPISGFSDCAARSRMDDALAALLVTSPGSGPPGSPNISPQVFVRASRPEANPSRPPARPRPPPRSSPPARIRRCGGGGRAPARAVALGVPRPRRSDHRSRDRGPRPVRRVAVLAAAVTLYVLAAWTVAPGFYDGFGPPAPYNWTCPPPQAGANTKPGAGHVDIKVVGGVSDAGSAYDRDGQIVMGFLPGAFDGTGKTSIAVDVTPLPTCPEPSGTTFVTNVYQVTASPPLVKDATLLVRYSNLKPAPSDAYVASDPGGPWSALGIKQQAQVFTVATPTKQP